MITAHQKAVGTILVSAAVVALDEFAKNVALRTLPPDSALVNPGLLSLAVHKNYGVAFDIPFRLPIVVGLTLIILAFLFRMAYRHWKTSPQVTAAATIVILGAAGNLFDRLVYGFTVDYLILFGRSAINLSDTLIVIGVFTILLSGKYLRRKRGELSLSQAE